MRDILARRGIWALLAGLTFGLTADTMLHGANDLMNASAEVLASRMFGLTRHFGAPKFAEAVQNFSMRTTFAERESHAQNSKFLARRMASCWPLASGFACPNEDLYGLFVSLGDLSVAQLKTRVYADVGMLAINTALVRKHLGDSESIAKLGIPPYMSKMVQLRAIAEADQAAAAKAAKAEADQAAATKAAKAEADQAAAAKAAKDQAAQSVASHVVLPQIAPAAGDLDEAVALPASGVSVDSAASGLHDSLSTANVPVAVEAPVMSEQ